MKIAIPKERRAGEARVAASPDTIKKFIGLGFEVAVETGAGAGASIPDAAFAEAGAKIAPVAASALRDADIVLKVQRPLTAAEGGADEIAGLKRGAKDEEENAQCTSSSDTAKGLTAWIWIRNGT